jgi:hypothetical protein
MTPPDTLTPAQRRLADLAAALASANPDAAEALGAMLVHEAAQRKRVRGFGIVVRWNEVTGRVELLTGE